MFLKMLPKLMLELNVSENISVQFIEVSSLLYPPESVAFATQMAQTKEWVFMPLEF